MGSLTYSSANIEGYTQNGFDVAKATWPALQKSDFAWGGQIEYYFYKDGKYIYLLGRGQNSDYIVQVAKSITSK